MKNASDLIRSDLTLHGLSNRKTYTSKEIDNATNFLKQQIVKSLNGDTLNKLIYIDTNDFFIVVCGLKAAWSLGCGIFVNDNNPRVRELPYFQEFYKQIHLTILPHTSSTSITTLTKCISFGDYDSTKLYTETENVEFDPDNTTAYAVTSSGTINDPRLIKHTHTQTLAVSNLLASYMNADESSRPFHFKTLHHSSLFVSFGLPLLSKCSTHWYGDFNNYWNFTEFSEIQRMEWLLNTLKSYKLTHFLCPYNWIRHMVNIQSIDFENLVTLLTINGNTDTEMIDLFKRFNPKQVINNFGCSEIGTMFLSKTTKDNVNNYNPNKFYDVAPYLDYEIFPDFIKVKHKTETQWLDLADRFTQEGKNIWFYGRSQVFKNNNIEISLSVLQQFLEKQYQTIEFNIVPDYKKEKLYLAIYDNSMPDLEVINFDIREHLSGDYVIDKILNIEYLAVAHGMKVNNPLLLWKFRSMQ